MPNPSTTVRAGLALWAAVLATIVIGPLRHKGWVLLLDWVDGPRRDQLAKAFNGARLPAGPLYHLVGGLLQRTTGATAGWLFPWLCLVAAGWGAARLVGGGTVAKFVAVTAYLWNPFVQERFYSGQMAVLAGYAVLPYLARAAWAPPKGQRWWLGPLSVGGWWALATACTVHLAVIGGVVVLGGAAGAFAGGETRVLHRVGLSGAVAALATGVWLAPMAATAPRSGGGAVLDSFLTRGDRVLGLAVGVLTQRGFWRPSLGEPGADSASWWPSVAVLLVVAALLGLVVAAGRGGLGCALPAASCLVFGWLGAQGVAGPFGGSYRWFVSHVALAGIMREPGKFIALISLASTVGLAALADGAASRLRRLARYRLAQPALALAAVVVILAPTALAPHFGGGVHGRLRAVRYPEQWAQLRRALDAETAVAGEAAGVVALPWTGYLNPGFTDERIVAHPAPAYFGRFVEVSNDAQLGGLAGDGRSRRIGAALREPDGGRDLTAMGIRFVLDLSGDGAAALSDQAWRRVATVSGAALYRYDPAAVNGSGEG